MEGLFLFFIILGACSIAFFLAYNFLATWFNDRQRAEKETHRQLVDQVVRLEAERRSLGAELADLEKKLNFLKHDIKPKATLAHKIDIPEDDTTPDSRMADYMLTKSMITMEQHQKAIKMIDQLQMDFVAVCQTLGFITAEQASAVKKQIK